MAEPKVQEPGMLLGRLLTSEGWSQTAFALLMADLRQGHLDPYDLEWLEDSASERRAARAEEAEHEHEQAAEAEEAEDADDA